MSHQTHELPKLHLPESNTVQQMVGTFLYYVCTVYPTMLVALDSIEAEQTNITQATAKEVNCLINYTATHSEAIKRYHTSRIVLNIHSEISFLSGPKAKSRAGGYN